MYVVGFVAPMEAAVEVKWMRVAVSGSETVSEIVLDDAVAPMH